MLCTVAMLLPLVSPKSKQARPLREKVEINHEKYPLLDLCSNKCRIHCFIDKRR